MCLLLHSAPTALLLPLPTSQCAIIDENAGNGEASFPFPYARALSLSLALCSDISVPLLREKCQLKSNRKYRREQRGWCYNSLPKLLHLICMIITYRCELLSNQWKKEKKKEKNDNYQMHLSFHPMRIMKKKHFQHFLFWIQSHKIYIM